MKKWRVVGLVQADAAVFEGTVEAESGEGAMAAAREKWGLIASLAVPYGPAEVSVLDYAGEGIPPVRTYTGFRIWSWVLWLISFALVISELLASQPSLVRTTVGVAGIGVALSMGLIRRSALVLLPSVEEPKHRGLHDVMKR